MPIVHLTVKLREPLRCRLEGEHAAWLFAHLRRAFPHALAVTLMPNHPHVLADVVDVGQAHASFVKTVGAFTRHFSLDPPLWRPVPAGVIVVGADKILRAVRYIALNPTRKRIVTDPLAWYWSTYRDVLGATFDPWVTFDRLRPYFPAWMRSLERLQAYVSADSSTRVDGTPMPRAAEDVEIAQRPLADMLRAAIVATRATSQEHRRRGPTRDAFVWLAATQGWRDPAMLARVCDVTPNAIARMLRGEPPAALAPARMCLGDARLLAGERTETVRSALDNALSNLERPVIGRSHRDSALRV